MTTYQASRLAAMQARIKRICSELDNANRRMFDIRTGESLMGRQPRQPRNNLRSRSSAPSH